MLLQFINYEYLMKVASITLNTKNMQTLVVMTITSKTPQKLMMKININFKKKIICLLKILDTNKEKLNIYLHYL